jgi:hypothetical protein
MKNKYQKPSVVASFNRILNPQNLELGINYGGYQPGCGFFFIEDILTGEIRNRDVDLKALGKWIQTHGTSPPPDCNTLDSYSVTTDS